MALVNRTDSELGNIIVNTETRRFITGKLVDGAMHLSYFGDNLSYTKAPIESEEAWEAYLLDQHTDLVAELESEGYGTDYSAL